MAALVLDVVDNVVAHGPDELDELKRGEAGDADESANNRGGTEATLKYWVRAAFRSHR